MKTTPTQAQRSPPSRAAWIEIFTPMPSHIPMMSPPSRAAWIEIPFSHLTFVSCPSPPSRAAWIEMPKTPVQSIGIPSPPSRAAWIEIMLFSVCVSLSICRRLHGRRGLKWSTRATCFRAHPSPPSRAAWIEIAATLAPCRYCGSPPSRAAWIEIFVIFLSIQLARSRRLHGRRGLKSLDIITQFCLLCVAAFTGGVD